MTSSQPGSGTAPSPILRFARHPAVLWTVVGVAVLSAAVVAPWLLLNPDGYRAWLADGGPDLRLTAAVLGVLGTLQALAVGAGPMRIAAVAAALAALVGIIALVVGIVGALAG